MASCKNCVGGAVFSDDSDYPSDCPVCAGTFEVPGADLPLFAAVLHHCGECGRAMDESLMELVPSGGSAYWACRECLHALASDEWRPTCASWWEPGPVDRSVEP